jgi:putative hydrolase of the HAD superfamily
MNNVKAIIFDLGGVVLNLDYDLTINAFKKLGGSNFDNLYSQAQQDKIFDKYEVGDISTTDFISYLKSFLPEEVSNEQVIDAWNVMLLDLPLCRVELLRKLRNEYQIFLFSNTNEMHMECFRRTLKDVYGNEKLLEDLFIQTYYSHQEKKRKPNAEAFQQVLNDHGLTAEETLFIDDSIQHIEGAGKIGLQTVHLVDKDIVDIFNFE